MVFSYDLVIPDVVIYSCTSELKGNSGDHITGEYHVYPSGATN